MFFGYLFVISGLLIAILIGAKVWEERSRKHFFLLSLISRGDERFRTWSHITADQYVHMKQESIFFITREAPLQARSFMTKTNALMKAKSEEFLNVLRGSRLLKKSGGMSEFLKSISEMEEEGRIDDRFEDPNKQ